MLQTLDWARKGPEGAPRGRESFKGGPEAPPRTYSGGGGATIPQDNTSFWSIMGLWCLKEEEEKLFKIIGDV